MQSALQWHSPGHMTDQSEEEKSQLQQKPGFRNSKWLEYLCIIVIKKTHYNFRWEDLTKLSPRHPWLVQKNPWNINNHMAIYAILTFTAVSRVISFPIRSTSTGRHTGNSVLRLSPNVEMTSPMQDIAHSLTSWIRRNLPL